MSDAIGRITVPSVVSSGLTFPLVSDFGYGFTQSLPVVVHKFGNLDAKAEQRYQVGVGPRKFQFRRANLSLTARNSLAAFWESLQGSYQSFAYNAPNADQTTTAVTVVWEQTPLSLDYLIHACKVGLNFVEIPNPASAPSYTVASTCTRFPSSTLATALGSQVQQIIPLVHIKVRESAVPDIYVSDRRCTVGGQLYIPRVLGIGEPGNDVILTQDIKGSADSVQFQFGNGDSVMTNLANDTDLKYAKIDISLYHVQTGILLQLWAGYVQTFTVDGSPVFNLSASDGIFQINQQYPTKTISRTCWKTYNDGLNCPAATQGASSAAVIAAGGDPNSCDYYWNSANGCLVHGMADFFGGIPLLSQSVSIKDNSTGFLGFDRNTVTSTSIVSDTIWGKALAEIWCNDGGSPVSAFVANCLIAAVRDNGDFFDVLGIIGVGPLGGFAVTGNSAGVFVTNADGFTYLVAPMADGFTAHGLRIGSNGTSLSRNNSLGLRQIPGFVRIGAVGDQSFNQFGLANIVGQNTPTSVGGSAASLPYSPQTAFCELLYSKPSGITPSATDSHSMTVPIAQGLGGYTWGVDVQYGLGGLMGAFTDTSGVVIEPVWFGDGPTTLTAPIGTTQLQIGVSDDKYADNDGSFVITVNGTSHTVLGTAMPWLHTGGINSLYPYSIEDGTAPVVVSIAAGASVTVVYVSGLVSAKPGSFPYTDANGDTAVDQTVPGSTGTNHPAFFLPSAGRVSQGGITNPFWIAINTFLRALGMDGASSTDQEALFVRSSVFAGDGSGCAEIADTVVTPVIGAGTERQFQFQGSIDSQKPLRDWLVEILNCGLGYFTWEFGKLKLGCRINASSVDAYNQASMKFQSLKLIPIEAAFERVIIDFADVQYQYQANTAEYIDKDHAAYYGRAGAPLTSRMHSVGSPTLSQNLRIAATRTREELGGVNATEWRNARNATWETTLLGLSNEIGQVVSITDPVKIPGLRGTCDIDGSGNVTWVSGDVLDTSILNKDILINGVQYAVTALVGSVTSFSCTPTVPSATGVAFKIITMDFRIQSWQLRKDWTIAMAAKTVTPSMYDLDVGPKPLDVLPQTVPGLSYDAPSSSVWCPFQVQYPSNDPMYPSEWTFDVQEVYSPTANGQPLTSVITQGKLPVNQYSPTAGAPAIGGISVSSTGGTIAGGSLVKLALCALDSNGLPSTPTGVVVVYVPTGTNTNSISVNSIVWPPVTGLTTYALFASTRDDLICEQVTGTLTAGGGGTTYTPSSVTLSALLRATWALPNSNTAQVILKAKGERHGGVIGASVTGVSSGHVISNDMIDTTGGGFTPVGRLLSIIGRSGGSVPLFNTTITSWNPLTGDMGCSPDPSDVVHVGDALLVRFLGYDNSAHPTQFTDTGIKNQTSDAYAGFTVNAETGYIIRVINGTSRGELRKITSNTSDTLLFDLPLVLDTTSVIVVENPTWDYSSEVTAVSNANPTAQTQLNLPASNLLDEVIIVSGFTVNIDGVESEDADQGIREIWLYGSQSTRVVTVNTSVLPTDGTIQVDSTSGAITVSFPDPTTMLNQTVIIQKTSSDANVVTITGPASSYTISQQWAYIILRGSI